VETAFGEVGVKIKWIGREAAGAMPEYEDCHRLADAANVPVRSVYEAATVAAQTLLATMRNQFGGHAMKSE
jgi:uncharacterized protein (DUF111 family)